MVTLLKNTGRILGKTRKLRVRAVLSVHYFRLFLTVCAFSALLMGGLSGPVQAQGIVSNHLTLKYGFQEASGDTIIEDLEADHGPLQENREMEMYGLEWDYIYFPEQTFGVGLGLEFLNMKKQYNFNDPQGVLPSQTVGVTTKAFLYTLKLYARKGMFWSFIGMGSGNYFIDYNEKVGEISIFDSAPRVFNTRVGLRIVTDRVGILIEYGVTRAPIIVLPKNNDPDMELGGEYRVVGLSWRF